MVIPLPVDVRIGGVQVVGSAEADEGHDRVRAPRDHGGVGGRLLQRLPRPDGKRRQCAGSRLKTEQHKTSERTGRKLSQHDVVNGVEADGEWVRLDK